MFISVSAGSGSRNIGRIVLDGLRISSTELSVKVRDLANPGTSRYVQAFLLCEIGSVRPFELSSAEGGFENIVEVRLRPEADVVALTDSLLMASGTEAHALNGDSHGQLAQHIVSLIFTRSDDSQQFAQLLQACWQSTDLSSMYGGPQEGRHDDEMSALLQGGPWDPDPLQRCMARGKETLSKEGSSGGPNGSVAPPPAQLPPAKDSQALPKVRAVIVGAPRAGKTRVAHCLASDLSGADAGGFKRQDEDSPAWVGVSVGTWPLGSRPRAEVHIWDGSAAPLPGLVGRIAAEPSVPLLVIGVVDAALLGLGVPAETLLATCAAEVSSSSSASSAPRRMLVVENVFHNTAVGNPDTLGAANAGSAPSRGPRTQSVRCSLQTQDGCTALRRSLGAVLGELVTELEARQRPNLPAVQLLGGSGPWGAAITGRFPLPLLSSNHLSGCGDLALASHLRGDSVFLHPSAISWAWATVRAAQGYLSEGVGVHAGGGALVPWERLERVLSSASSDGAAAAGLLLRGLADLGLVCPVPSMAVGQGDACSSLGCTWVLIPDFARRVRLANANSLRHACGLGSESGPDGGLPGFSARLVWDAPGGPPSLRATLRNFLAQGLLGAPSVDGRYPVPSWFEVRSFVLLEAGPTGSGATGLAAADGLLPGFIFVFDLATKAGGEGEVPQTNSGSGMSKPPASVTDPTPSGARTGETPRHGAGAGSMTGDDDLLAGAAGSSTGRLTAVAVGASIEATGKSKSSSAPFWDVHCVGPHAQWACRALLGNGAAGPGFVGYRRMAASKARNSSTGSSSTSPAWPLPAPACVLSQVDEGGGMFGSETPAPAEFVGLAWLFNAPSSATARTALGSTGGGGSNPIADCCAALCGKGPSQEFDATPDNGDVPGLQSCSSFEAALLSRNTWDMARFLDEVMASGAEAWSLCATSMARLAHDAASEAAGSQARTLPLLCEVGSSGGNPRVVSFVPDGPPAIAAGLKLGQQGAPLGKMRLGPGVEAWLRLCRPLALWSAAGSARGYAVVADELQSAATSRAGEQVSEALRVALSIKLTAPMVSEVWESLSELEVARKLVKRACGTWVHVDGGTGFLL